MCLPTTSKVRRSRMNKLVALPGPAGGAPPGRGEPYGDDARRVDDAVNAVGPIHHRPYLLTRRSPSKTSEEAACRDRGVWGPLQHRVDGAGEHPVPEQTMLQSLPDKYTASLAPIPDTPSRHSGSPRGTPRPMR
jgi:hypothetical protein